MFSSLIPTRSGLCNTEHLQPVMPALHCRWSSTHACQAAEATGARPPHPGQRCHHQQQWSGTQRCCWWTCSRTPGHAGRRGLNEDPVTLGTLWCASATQGPGFLHVYHLGTSPGQSASGHVPLCTCTTARQHVCCHHLQAAVPFLSGWPPVLVSPLFCLVNLGWMALTPVALGEVPPVCRVPICTFTTSWVCHTVCGTAATALQALREVLPLLLSATKGAVLPLKVCTVDVQLAPR
jgi:hypothetical protein